MYKLNKLFVLLLTINILIFSVQSYTLEKYDYDKFQKIISATNIEQSFEVTKNQLLIFKVTRELGDSPAAMLNITSNDAPENIIFYSTFEDQIADENNSEKLETITPLGNTLCFTDHFSFTIQMNNVFLGGDINILFKERDASCTKDPSSEDQSGISFSFSLEDSSKESSVSSQDSSQDSSLEVMKPVIPTSTASSSFVNQISILLIITLLSLLVI